MGQLLVKTWNSKKKFILCTALIAFFVGLFDFGILNTDVVEADTLKSQILSNNAEKLEKTADSAVSGAVKTAREIAFGVILAVAIWIGYAILIKKSAEGLADVKGRLAVILIAVAFIFFAETIIGTLFGWLGYQSS